MKRLYNNLRSWDDFLNLVLISIVMLTVYITNSSQYLKMWYYKLRGIDCFMYTADSKFGVKRCVRK
jgi:hypothetical protein